MVEFDDARHNLDAAAQALAARRSLYAAVTALAADPFDLGQALLVPLLQRRAREADHTLGAVVGAHMAPWAAGSSTGAHSPAPIQQSSRVGEPRATDQPLSGLQRLLADADAERRR